MLTLPIWMAADNRQSLPVVLPPERPENLDTTRHEPRRLKEALKLNESLAAAYYLKEDLRRLWDQPDKATC